MWIKHGLKNERDIFQNKKQTINKTFSLVIRVNCIVVFHIIFFPFENESCLRHKSTINSNDLQWTAGISISKLCN